MTEISIELEHDVYYAGDVVRGRVILKNKSATPSQGLMVHLKAAAETSWMEPSLVDGVPPKHLSGATVFQESVQTLCGASYRTGALRTSGQLGTYQGEAIDFDENVGQLIIDCSTHRRFQLWTMGMTATIDITKLMDENNGTQSYFLLSTTGNMTKGPVNLSGEWLQDKRLKLWIRQIKGVPRGTMDVYVRMTPIVRDEATKKDSPVLLSLPTGESSYDFSFRLRDDAPGSAYWNEGEAYANVFYELSAYSGFDQSHAKKMHLTVLANRPLPRSGLLSPYQMETGDQPLWKLSNLFCCCKSSGVTYKVSIKLHLGRYVLSSVLSGLLRKC